MVTVDVEEAVPAGGGEIYVPDEVTDVHEDATNVGE